ncbi:MAG TPA: hypothetical protein VHS79_06010 [Actinomycetes bacterium]|jgi:hypothetical protein|nr:hypothetical protein [Actinomycetes bacterium]
MSRIHRALTVLGLSLALAAGTAAAAVAAPETASAAAVEDQNDRLLRHIEASDLARTQAAVEQARAIERGSLAAQPAARVEDQNDRLLRSIQAGQAERTQAAVEQVRAGERNLGPAPVVTVAPQPVPAAGRNVDPLVVLLVGLVGGLIGGAAIAAGVAANRRHGQRAVAA